MIQVFRLSFLSFLQKKLSFNRKIWQIIKWSLAEFLDWIKIWNFTLHVLYCKAVLLSFLRTYNMNRKEKNNIQIFLLTDDGWLIGRIEITQKPSQETSTSICCILSDSIFWKTFVYFFFTFFKTTPIVCLGKIHFEKITYFFFFT